MAVARVLGMIVSKPDGCRLLVTATLRRSVGGIDHPVEGLGGLDPGRQHADVVDDDEVGPADTGDDPPDGAVDLGTSDGRGQRIPG